MDQRSDFTFVLSNPTDFNNECTCQDSFITQKHARLLQTSTNQEPQLKSSQNARLPEIPASPIYSESGQIPQPVAGHFHCLNCGGNRRELNKAISSANMLNRRSYNNLPPQSIKEESDDGSEQ